MTNALLSIRIDLPQGRLGPGKAALLDAIDDCGSIAAAARQLGMSYARAWSLTEQMNGCFGQRLIDTFAGGSERGGARLTPSGQEVLRLYRSIAAAAAKAVRHDLDALAALTR